MIRRATLALLALPLAGCARGSFSLAQGGISDSATAFGSDHSLNFTCSRYDPVTGNITDQVTIQRALNPNAATVAALAAGFQAVVGLAGAIAKPAPQRRRDGRVPGPMGAPPGIPPGYTLDVPTCLGEHGVNTPMLPPGAPVPPQAAPPRQPAAFDPGWHQGVTGTWRYLEPVADDGRASYYTVAGRHYVVSAGAWLAWAEGGA